MARGRVIARCGVPWIRAESPRACRAPPPRSALPAGARPSWVSLAQKLHRRQAVRARVQGRAAHATTRRVPESPV
jgi:hypothetical protein